MSRHDPEPAALALPRTVGSDGSGTMTASPPSRLKELRLPSVRALLAFSAASRCGSFAQAAEEVGVTPSAVSHHLQQLEDYLGTRLFERDGGRTLLTPAGRVYAGEVEHALSILKSATSLVSPRLQATPLVIASSPSFATKWLQPRLPDFLSAHPGIKVRLSTLCYRDDLEADSFDVAIAYGRAPLTRKVIEPLFVDRLRPLCSPKLASDAKLHAPPDLARVNLVHSVNALTWADYLRHIEADDVRPTGEIWLDQSDMAIQAAVDGVGVVLESEILAAAEIRAGALVAPFDGDRFSVATASYYLVKSRSQRNASQVRAFETWLRGAL